MRLEIRNFDFVKVIDVFFFYRNKAEFFSSPEKYWENLLLQYYISLSISLKACLM